MRKQEIINLIREEIKAALPEPGTKEKEKTKAPPKRKRRSLSPPEESPSTKPKALMEKEEEEILNKIAKRFKNLNNGV